MHQRMIPEAEVDPCEADAVEGAADYVREVEHGVDDQVSISSAISIVLSTSMPGCPCQKLRDRSS